MKIEKEKEKSEWNEEKERKMNERVWIPFPVLFKPWKYNDGVKIVINYYSLPTAYDATNILSLVLYVVKECVPIYIGRWFES